MNTPTLTRSQALAQGILEEPAIGRKRAKREARKTYANPSSWGGAILRALQHQPVFQGIDAEEDPAAANRLAKRRRKNRLAKASRKANRR